MGQRRKHIETVGISVRFPANIAVKFKNLSESNGISLAEGLRRIIVDAIMQNRIPGVSPLNFPDSEETQPLSDKEQRTKELEKASSEEADIDGRFLYSPRKEENKLDHR